MIRILSILQLAALSGLGFGDLSVLFPPITAPYHVSVRTQGVTNCHGAIYKRDYILTAASCVKGFRNTQITVKAGTNRRCVKYSTVCETIIHDGYKSNSYTNNLALLRLCRPLKFNNRIEDIEAIEDSPEDNADATTTVWQQKLIKTVRLIRQSVISKDQCSEELSDAKNNVLVAAKANDTICAGAEDAGPCREDIGAPLVVENQLAGILSYASCSSGPNVYINLVQHKNWLKAKSK